MSGGIYKAGSFSNPGTDMGVVPPSKPADELTIRRAIRAAASLAKDAGELAVVLDMLGLDPAAGKYSETEQVA